MNLENTIKFSVLTPTLNEEKYIGILLSSLVNQTYKNFEVIIVDSQSQDKTKEVVLKFSNKLDLKFIEAPKKGVSHQRNYAASLAKNEHLVFFDADVAPEPTFLEKIAQYISENHPDVLTSWNVPISDKLIDEFIYWLHNWLMLEAIKKTAPGAVGTFIYVRKKAFGSVGGFQEDLTFAEDFDLVKRLHDKGFKYSLLRDPKIRVSVRRFEKEGRLNIIWKNIRAAYLYSLNGANECKDRFKHEVGKF